MNDFSYIYYQPKRGDEVVRAIHSHPPIYKYSELVDQMRRWGAANVLYKMGNRNLDSLILVQDPNDENSGHWTSLSFHPETREVYFFSSYGGKPDQEKIEWISADNRLRSNQNLNVFNDGLKTLMVRDGWTVHYNNYPFQKIGDHTATCGIWCAAFINSNLNPDQFVNYVQAHHATPRTFYARYFA